MKKDEKVINVTLEDANGNTVGFNASHFANTSEADFLKEFSTDEMKEHVFAGDANRDAKLKEAYALIKKNTHKEPAQVVEQPAVKAKSIEPPK